MTTPEQTEPTPTETYLAWLARVQLPLDHNRDVPYEAPSWQMHCTPGYEPRLENGRVY